MPDAARRFGRFNQHCVNCGDERGGPFGHEISECRYRSGMTAAELAATMSAEKAARWWDYLIDGYFDVALPPLPQDDQPSPLPPSSRS